MDSTGTDGGERVMRLPGNIVIDASELAALQDGTVIVTEDGGIAWQKGDSDPDNPAASWWTAGLKHAHVPPLPATVVWQPDDRLDSAAMDIQ